MVLAIVVVVSGYASVSHQLPSHYGLQTDANALVMNQGGQMSDFYLGRFSTIVKPLSIPTGPMTSHSASIYTVSDGEDLRAVATKFNLTIEEIRWSNPILKDTDRVSGGVKLSIPPTHGVVVTAHAGDSVQALADAYHSDAETIINFNRLRDDPNSLPDGIELVIPGGHGPQLTIRTMPYQSVRSSGGGYKVTIGAPTGPFASNRFGWGWCTYYVASRRDITWAGDAYQWFANAQSQGYSVGSSPETGAVMVTWESGLGHVAYVESVNPDGSWLVSEMNFAGFGVASQRTIRSGQVPLIGFIYSK